MSYSSHHLSHEWRGVQLDGGTENTFEEGAELALLQKWAAASEDRETLSRIREITAYCLEDVLARFALLLTLLLPFFPGAFLRLLV